jgi:hypothetical protein
MNKEYIIIGLIALITLLIITVVILNNIKTHCKKVSVKLKEENLALADRVYYLHLRRVLTIDNFKFLNEVTGEKVKTIKGRLNPDTDKYVFTQRMKVDNKYKDVEIKVTKIV